jgi:hypothetical protein
MCLRHHLSGYSVTIPTAARGDCRDYCSSRIGTCRTADIDRELPGDSRGKHRWSAGFSAAHFTINL